MYSQYSNYFPEQESEQLEYSLIISSSKCPYSTKIINLLNDSNINLPLEVYDVQHFIKSGQDIPNYVDGTPELIISNTEGQIQQVLLGYQQVSEWIESNKPKQQHDINSKKSKLSSTNTSSFTSIADSHGKCRLPPPKIQVDEYGRPTCGSEVFAVKTDDKPRSEGLDLNNIQKERDSLNKELNIPAGSPPMGQTTQTIQNSSSRKLQPVGTNNTTRNLSPVGINNTTRNLSSNNSSGGRGKYAPVGK